MKKTDFLQEYLNEYAKVYAKVFGKEYAKEYWEEPYNNGIIIGQVEMLQNMLEDNDITLETAIKRLTMLNCELEEISKITGLPTTEIKTIINQQPQSSKKKEYEKPEINNPPYTIQKKISKIKY